MMTAAEILRDGAVVSAAAADLTSLYPAHLPLFFFFFFSSHSFFYHLIICSSRR
jgi:hypothetical protein